MNIPQTNLKRIVIIGAGFAGLRLAKKINTKNYQVVLVDRNNYHTFQPLLYQVATAGLEPDSIAHAVRTIFKSSENFYFRIANIYNIIPEENKIESNIGDLEYDYLVVATGSKTNYYGNENIKRNAIAMKSIPQALDLRSLILQNLEAALLTNDLDERRSLMNFVIVGGGPTGVELAGAFGELKKHVLPNDYPDLDIRVMDVHLVQSGNRLLPSMSEKASGNAKKYLEEIGVKIWLNTRVFDYDGKKIDTNNKDLEATTLIWTAGVTGALVKGIDNENCVIKGRFLVNEYNQIHTYDNVYAIGDIACMQSEKNPKGHPMLAQVAIQQGKLLAKNFNNLSKNKPLKRFKYKDKGSMATVGRNKAVVDLPNFKFGGFFAWMVWMFVHLVSLVGFRNKMVALANWVVQYFQYNKSVRLIIRPYVKEVPYYDIEEKE